MGGVSWDFKSPPDFKPIFTCYDDTHIIYKKYVFMFKISGNKMKVIAGVSWETPSMIPNYQNYLSQ